MSQSLWILTNKSFIFIYMHIGFVQNHLEVEISFQVPRLDLCTTKWSSPKVEYFPSWTNVQLFHQLKQRTHWVLDSIFLVDA